MTTPRERIAKGSDLEKAVELIENAILTASPSLKEKTFAIERRKILTVAGVRHEIDVWVEIDAGKEYRSIFIFECKNWQDKVGKNEIIIFSEKIKASQAMWGFCLAPTFTSDAEAQCQLDPRMKLLIAQETSPLFARLPDPVVVITNVERAALSLSVAGPLPRNQGTNVPCTYRNETTTVETCRKRWVEEILQEQMGVLVQAARQVVDSPRTVMIGRDIVFQPGELMVEGKNISSARLDLEIQIDVSPTRIAFQYEVETRGWAVSWEPIKRTTPMLEGV